jgi:hypothetical protein
MSAALARVRALLATEIERDALLDAVFVLGLSLLGLVGFQTTFGGATYLIVGGVAVVLGIVMSELSQRLGQPVLIDVALTALVFFLLGGVLAAPESAIGGVLPTPGTIAALAGAGTQGWKELLTTALPVGDSADLLTIPYMIGLVAGMAGYSLARRTRRVALPLVAPASILVLSILFGTEAPAALLLQGSLFAAVVLAWLTLRAHRWQPPNLTGTRRRRRVVRAVGVVAVAALLSPIVGPHLPFGGGERIVLSRYVAPPFDASEQASPLGTFRTYTSGSPHSLADTTLFTVRGVQPGTLVTIATMDEYDGLSWGFGGEGGSTQGGAGDVFRHYGSTIAAALPGRTEKVTVEVEGLDSVWVPDAGEVTGVQFSGPGATSLGAAFNYDPVTTTAADPVIASRGDSYQITVVVPPTPTTAQLSAAGAGSDQLAVTVPTPLQTAATRWAVGATGAWGKVMKIAQTLKTQGSYSNGTEDPPLAEAGNSAGRLDEFVEGDPSVNNQLVGDDEQFAATLAVMSNAVGVPARVVLGAQVGSKGVVTGRDIQAWVQVSLTGLGWVTVERSLFTPTRAAAQPLPQAQPTQLPQAVVPPPNVAALPPPAQPLQSNATGRSGGPTHAHQGTGIPAVLADLLIYGGSPLLLIVVACSAILGLKARRRRRRRSAGSPSSRIAGAWNELLDFARDLGHAVPAGSTRREQAQLISASEVGRLAGDADAAVFGPGDPTPEHVDGYWSAMDAARQALAAGRGRWGRIRAALSLRSLRSDLSATLRAEP